MDIYSTSSAVPPTNYAPLADIRAYRERQRLRADDESLADQKAKLDRFLKKHNHSSDELPSEFWSLDREQRGFIVGQILGPDAPAAKARAARQLKRMTAQGYPADYYSHTDDERRRISGAVRARRWRAKKPKAAAPPIASRAIPYEVISRGWHTDKLALLRAWTARTSPRARKLRGREPELTKAALIYQALGKALARQPSLGEFAARLGCSRAAAQKRAALLVDLYAAGGPWHAKALRGVSDKALRGVSDKSIETTKEMAAGRVEAV